MLRRVSALGLVRSHASPSVTQSLVVMCVVCGWNLSEKGLCVQAAVGADCTYIRAIPHPPPTLRRKLYENNEI